MRQRAGWIWLIAGIVIALFAGLMTFRTLATATATRALQAQVPMTQVVVAARDVPANNLLIPADLEVKEVPDQFIPATSLSDMNEALDKVTTVNLSTGEVLQASRLITPNVTVAENLAFTIPAGKVVMAMPAVDLMSKSGILKANDKVDVHVTMKVASSGSDSSESFTTISALQSLTITAIVVSQLDLPEGPSAPGSSSDSSKSPTPLLFALDPQDALVLKYMLDTGSIVSLVLRASKDDELSRTEPVDLPYLSDKYNFTVPTTSGGGAGGGQ